MAYITSIFSAIFVMHNMAAQPIEWHDSSKNESIWSLFIPIMGLIISSVDLLIWTGYRNSDTKSIID